MNVKTLKVIAVVLLVVIVLGAGIYWMVSGMSNRGLEGFQAAATTTQPITIPAPPTPTIILGNFRNATNQEWKVGKKHTFRVTGTNGTIWGGGDTDGTYTLDSPIAVAAVHAGIVPIGKTGIVNIIITAGQNSYTGSSRNSITSNNFAKPYEASYRFEKDGRYILKQNINTTLKIRITGRAGFNIWGGGDVLATYTADSPVTTAAVHAGIVKEGEDKEITILILPGIDTYIGVTRNGITSSNFGKYDKAYRFIDPALPVLNQDLGKIQSELEQKNNNLAAAQSELAAASAALNNAIKSYEGFQSSTNVITTTSTTAQIPSSPILEKINQLKEKQKLAVEKVKAAADAQIGTLQSNKSQLETEKTGLQSNKARLTQALSSLGIQDSANVVADTQTLASKLVSTSSSLNSILAENFQDVTTATSPSLIPMLDKITSQITQLKSMRNDARAAIAGVQNKLSAQGYDMSALDTVLSNAGKVTILESELKNAKDAKLAAEEALKTANQNLQTANTGDITNRATISRLESELNSARDNVTDKQAQIDSINKALAEATARSVQQVENARLDERSIAEQKYNQLQASYNQLNNDLQTAKQEILRLDSIKNTAPLTDTERAKLSSDLASKLDEISMLNNKLAEVEKQLAACNASMQAMPIVTATQLPSNTTATTQLTTLSGSTLTQPTTTLPMTYTETTTTLPMTYPETTTTLPMTYTSTTTLPMTYAETTTTLPMTYTPTTTLPMASEETTTTMQASTTDIADTSILSRIGFTNIPKTQAPYTWENPYWTYRPENYDSQDRYAAPSPWWVTGFNA